MNTANPIDAAINRRIQASARDILSAARLTVQSTDPRWARLIAGYSLARAIANLSSERRNGVELEVHEELSRIQPAEQMNSLRVPWEVVTPRADTVSVSTAGGYLVETANLPAADFLRANAVLAALGATVIPSDGANITLPIQKSAATGYWIGSETTQITETDQTFGQLALSPKTVGTYTEASRQLLIQSNAEAVIRRDIGMVVGRTIDHAGLYGTGVNGQPLGLTNVPGIGSFSGTSLALAGLIDAETSLGDGLNSSVGVATTLTVAGVLAKRQKFTGGDTALWEGALPAGACAGMNARSSTALTSGNLFVGSWGYFNIAVWGGGIEISINPYDQTNFQKGIVGMRCFASVDMGATWPSAFTLAGTVN